MVRSGTRVPIYISSCHNTVASSNEHMRSSDHHIWGHIVFPFYSSNVFRHFDLYLWIIFYENYNYRTIIVITLSKWALYRSVVPLWIWFSSDPTLVTWCIRLCDKRTIRMILLVYQSSHRHLNWCVATSELTGCWQDWFICLSSTQDQAFDLSAPSPRPKTVSSVREIGSSNNNISMKFQPKHLTPSAFLPRHIYQQEKDNNAKKFQQQS